MGELRVFHRNDKVDCFGELEYKGILEFGGDSTESYIRHKFECPRCGIIIVVEIPDDEVKPDASLPESGNFQKNLKVITM